MKIGDKVRVRVTKSAMNSTLVEMDLKVCYQDTTDTGKPFWGGRNQHGKIRYFDETNIIKL